MADERAAVAERLGISLTSTLMFGSSIAACRVEKRLNGAAEPGFDCVKPGLQRLRSRPCSGPCLHSYAGRVFFACGHSEIVVAPNSQLPVQSVDLPDDGLLCLVRYEQRANFRRWRERKKCVVDARRHIERNRARFVGNEDREGGRLVGGLRFGDVDQAPVGHAPDGMVDGYSIELRPPADHPAERGLPTALLRYRGHVPIAVSDWAQTAGALYLHRDGVGLYLSCNLLHNLMIDWWRDFGRGEQHAHERGIP